MAKFCPLKGIQWSGCDLIGTLVMMFKPTALYKPLSIT